MLPAIVGGSVATGRGGAAPRAGWRRLPLDAIVIGGLVARPASSPRRPSLVTTLPALSLGVAAALGAVLLGLSACGV